MVKDVSLKVRTLYLIEDDSKVGEFYLNLLKDEFKESIIINPVFELNTLQLWLDNLLKDPDIENKDYIILSDYNFTRWDKDLLHLDQAPIENGADLVVALNKLNKNFTTIIYSNNAFHANFQDFVLPTLPEDTVVFDKKPGDPDLANKLKNAVSALISGISPLELKENPESKFIPSCIRFFGAQDSTMTAPMSVALARRLLPFYDPSSTITFDDFGIEYCEEDKVDTEATSYFLEPVDLTIYIDNEAYFTRGLKLNRLNLILMKFLDAPFDLPEVAEAWDEASDAEKAVITAVYPKWFIENKLKVEKVDSLINPDTCSLQLLSSFDLLFKLQVQFLVLDAISSHLKNEDRNKDVMDKWAEITGVKLHEVIEYEVKSINEESEIATCKGLGTSNSKKNKIRYLPTALLEKFGCAHEEAEFHYFVFDNPFKIPTYLILPII